MGSRCADYSPPYTHPIDCLHYQYVFFVVAKLLSDVSPRKQTKPRTMMCMSPCSGQTLLCVDFVQCNPRDEQRKHCLYDQPFPQAFLKPDTARFPTYTGCRHRFRLVNLKHKSKVSPNAPSWLTTPQAQIPQTPMAMHGTCLLCARPSSSQA